MWILEVQSVVPKFKDKPGQGRRSAGLAVLSVFRRAKLQGCVTAGC